MLYRPSNERGGGDHGWLKVCSSPLTYSPTMVVISSSPGYREGSLYLAPEDCSDQQSEGPLLVCKEVH